MIKKIKQFSAVIVVVILAMVFGAGIVLGANDVSVGSGASIVLPSNGQTYTLGTNTSVTSFVVNNGTIEVNVEASSIFNFTSTDRSTFSISGAPVECGTSVTCGTSSSELNISCSSGLSGSNTVTITPIGTCAVAADTSSAGTPGGGSISKSTPKPTPTPTPVPPPAPVTVTSPVVQPATPTVTETVLLVSESAVQVVSLPKYSYQPNETLKFSYKYKNEGAKTVTVKITRQLLDSKGKVVKTATATKSLKSGATFTGSVQDMISKTLKPGLYTERVRVLNTKNKTLDENSFVINVEKLKSKVFSIGEVASLSSDLAFDGTVLSKVKTNVKLPTFIKLKYSYTNSTDKKHTTKMVRQLIDASHKVLQTNTGKWVMDAGEKYAQSFTQSLASTLSAGDYTLKITAYDWTTKELLAENSIGFAVELK